jgi:predicted DsbA family dithiol-disulfide isomerase
MHARLFTHQQTLGLTDLPQHAQAIGLDLPQFQRCLESGTYAETIRKDLAEGQKAGVTGTPTFFLGATGPNDSKIKAVRVLTGAQPYTSFKEAIDSLLSSQK